MTCNRQNFWLGSENAGLYTCLHSPNHRDIHSVGIVLCNALGHEYTHSHRSMRYLADKLADSGFACIRFDYYGTGDSAGDLSFPLSISCWMDNLDQQIQTLKESTGVSAICLIGLRMGASLAAKYAESKIIDYLVLWNPCISGRRYIREMQAIGIMASNKLSASSGDEFNGIESAGFVMHNQTANEIQNIDLKKLNYQKNFRQCHKILLIDRDDTVVNNKYFELLKKNDLNVEQIRMPGFLDMIAEPQDSIIPKSTIQFMVNWISLAAKEHAHFDLSKIQDYKRENLNVFEWGATTIKETICRLGDNPLIGVLSQPLTPNHQNHPLIILSNSGAAHHVGPNRLYIELSRALSANGYPCLRVDLANLGDSISCNSIHDDIKDENHPYPENAVDDIKTVINSMKNDFKFSRFVLAGLCSGSHTSFHAGLSHFEPHIEECILINPLTFYWKEGMSLDIPHAYATIKDAKYYQYAIKDYQKWLKVLKGQAQIHHILKFIIKYISEKFTSALHKILELFNLKKASTLAKDISRLKELNTYLSFFFSTTDPGYNILRSEAKKVMQAHIREKCLKLEFIENADHTFSDRQSRMELIEKLKNHIIKRYPGDKSESRDRK